MENDFKNQLLARLKPSSESPAPQQVSSSSIQQYHKPSVSSPVYSPAPSDPAPHNPNDVIVSPASAISPSSNISMDELIHELCPSLHLQSWLQIAHIIASQNG
jgi:hypothetical protein